ncbi:MAG: hypothetical protein RR048_04030, partial [Oscillospiraceae bacterium]
MTTWAENNISKQDLMLMQHDAVRRVKEMQRQATENLHKTSSTFSQQETEHPEEVAEQIPKNPNTQNNNEPLERNNTYQNANPRGTGWANNRGYLGPNQNSSRQQFQQGPKNTQEKKSPFGMLSNLFQKTNEAGGISDIINGLIPKRDGDSPISKVLDALNLDTEKLIIIVLIVLLLNDGAD